MYMQKLKPGTKVLVDPLELGLSEMDEPDPEIEAVFICSTTIFGLPEYIVAYKGEVHRVINLRMAPSKQEGDPPIVHLHGYPVNIGDRVWHYRFGWGKVIDLLPGYKYPIKVLFRPQKRGDFGEQDWFSSDGYPELPYVSVMELFWQPIKFEIPEKPANEGD